jgi:hypothetical protein
MAKKAYTLAALGKNYKNIVLSKGADSHRLQYEALIGVYPIDFWPKAARDYALLDAKTTYEVWEAQGGDIVNECEQCKSAFSFHLMSCWGVRCDKDAVQKAKDDFKKTYEDLRIRLVQHRILRTDGTKNKKLIQARVAKAYGIDYDAFVDGKVPLDEIPEHLLTEKNDICTSREVLEGSGDPGLELLAEFTAVEKLLMTFIPVLERGTEVPINARYRPIMETGRSSCIAKGTLIETVRDVSKYPKGVPIEEVKPGDLVYTYDQKKRLTIRKVLASHNNGLKKVVRLHWQGSGHHTRGHLDLTPDHLVRRVGGKYSPVAELLPDDRVMALSRGTTHGYARLWATGHDEISREHRFIFQEVNGWLPEHVHHKNHNKLDNRPENLEGMSQSEHASEHGQNPSDELIAKRSYHSKRRWAEEYDKMYALLVRKGPDSANWLGLSQDDVLAILEKHDWSVTNVMKRERIDFDTFKKYMRMHDIDLAEIKDKKRATRNMPTLQVSKETLESALAANKWSLVLAAKALGYTFGFLKKKAIEFRLDLKELKRRNRRTRWGKPIEDHNHEVLFVEELPEPVEVFDLTIEETENYIANEICVHNCSDPNLQNLPRRGGIRECFVPRRSK